MRSVVVLFTRDLRVRDNPALTAAARGGGRVVPLFVLDEDILGSSFAAPNRLGFLYESLTDLRRSLGGRLLVRRGDVVAETLAVARDAGAGGVYLAADVSGHAQRREARLRERLEVQTFPGVTVVPPGDVAPRGGDHYRVFSPYWRAWEQAELRPVHRRPKALDVPDLPRGEIPSPPAGRSPEVASGGETEGRKRLERWLRSGLARYPGGLGDDATSRLSPYFHFGCLSPLEAVERARGRSGAGPWIREVCWRDFFAQLLRADPSLAHEDMYSHRGGWRDDQHAFAAWREGRTGYPLVDAGMRQLAREGWMANRARLVTASFLVKDLGIDWRVGARYFFDLLLDGDVASNTGNWQWVAGTGTDTNRYRLFNPTLQAKKLDPDGAYVRRYVPELADIEGGAVHEPWKLPRSLRPGYPDPIVDHAEAVRRIRGRRAESLDRRTRVR
jgi:deoxyribodipyrimidine photo-lyase